MIGILLTIAWIIPISLVTAIIVSNIGEAKLKEATVQQLNDDEDSLRWTAILKTKHRPHIESDNKYACKIKLVDSYGKFKPLHGWVYGINVADAEERAKDHLPKMIQRATERAESPALLIVRF